jgi:hypothetical protein
MAAKLKSISSQIHWPLLVKAIIFGFAWWLLPPWLFCVVAAGVYFLPSFESWNNFPAFIVLVGIALATPSAGLMALIYGALCYYLLLIKDFLVIDRKSARTILAMALSFFLFREFFSAWHAGVSPGSIFWAWIVGIAFGLLLNGIIAARRGKEVNDEHWPVHRLRHAAVAISALLLFEILVACLFLPVDFIYQSIIAFLAAAFMLDLVPAYFFVDLVPRRIRTTTTAVFILLVVTLASARWGL